MELKKMPLRVHINAFFSVYNFVPCSSTAVSTAESGKGEKGAEKRREKKEGEGGAERPFESPAFD